MRFVSLNLDSLLLINDMLQNVSEDTDDMFDDLFDRYGKVVYQSNDRTSPSTELDDDAESLSCELISQSI